MVVRFDNVSHIYSPGTPFEKKALSGINLCVEKGDSLCICGKTGSGKTTLIKHINGLLKPYSGEVKTDGFAGLVFQFPEDQLFAPTVIEDVMFGPLNMGKSREEARAAAEEALARAGMESQFYDRNPFTLSGGQKRLAALAGVLAMKPQILVLDEPTAGLDFRSSASLLKLLHRLNSEGVTVIAVTHEMNLARDYFSKLLILDSGHAVWNGNTADAFCAGNRELIEHAGLEMPQDNEIEFLLR